MLRAYPHYRRCDEATIERMIDGDLKEQPLPWLSGKSPRHGKEGLDVEARRLPADGPRAAKLRQYANARRRDSAGKKAD
ncbi:hypothetical protein ABIA00_003592 [Bradyrhizobium ottawaense]